MVFFFEALLGVSVLGLVTILTLKRLELNRGRKFFRSVRPAIDRFFHRSLVWFEHILPSAVEAGGRKAGHAFTRFITRVVARGMHYLERKLESLLHNVRQKTRPVQSEREASPFLREVANHKRSLGKERREEQHLER